MVMSTMMSHRWPDDGTMMVIFEYLLCWRERENIIRDDQGNDIVEMGGGR